MAADSSVSRRHAFIGGLCLCCSAALARRTDTSVGPFATHEVAAGIHIRRGVDQDATLTNGGAIANVGFIIGRDAVAVIDPGGSRLDGERLRATVREATRLPVRYVVMSHVHPDHVFGAAAFEADRPQFVGHVRLTRALAVRGEYYRKRLEEILGKDAAGPVVMPTVLVKDRTEIDLGGRVLALTAHGLAHSDCDLSVLDHMTATLLPADLLFVQRIPSLDGSLRGWVKELGALEDIGARRAVPGHGPSSVDWPSGARDLQRYLHILLRETRQAIAGGMDIDTTVQTIGRSERGKWKLFDDYHGHNITQAFKELEWE